MNKVVIIDDEPDLLEILFEEFSSQKFEVFCASNGLEGLKLIELHKPNLIVSDHTMPIMTGVELFKEIRKKNISIPFILLTGYTVEELIQQLGETVYFKVHPKPFMTHEIISVSQELLNTWAESPGN